MFAKVFNRYVFKLVIPILVLFIVLFNRIEAQALTFVENSDVTFNGARTNLSWSGASSALQISGSNLFGEYVSLIKDAGTNANWNSITYEPRAPYGKELVANSANETAYDQQEVNMVNSRGYWRFNESTATTVADSSGNGNQLSCSGSTCPTSSTTAKFNLARDFDGVDDYYDIGNNFTVKNQSIIAISTWVRPRNVSGVRTIFQESSPLGSFSRFGLEIVNGGLRLRVRDDDFNPVDVFLTTGNFVANTWYHILVTYNANSDQHRFYLNGNLVSSVSINMGTLQNTNPISSPKIGRHSDLVTEIFDGIIDETVIFFGRDFTGINEVRNIYRRGITKLQLQVRSCDDPACVGENFVGPGGLTSTFFSDEISTINALPNFNLIPTEAPNNRYFQFKFTFARESTNFGTQIQLQNVTIDYTLASPAPTLSFIIRNSTDTANTNTCNLGQASTSNTVICSYRLKVSTNSASGYQIFVNTSGSLTSSTTIANAPAGTGGGGGVLIDNTTAGTERYGVLINPGAITGTGSITRATAFNAGAVNSVNLSNTINQAFLTSTGSNAPGAIDTINTSLISHNLNISASTPAGRYTQTVTYTVTSSF